MNRDAAVAEATRWRPLPPAAVANLAHDLRGCVHVICGHAELLRAEAADEQSKESASYIVDASRVLGGLCEDVVDFLRLPEVVHGEPVVLALDDLALSLSMLAIDRGIQLRMVCPDAAATPLLVHPVVRRVLAHVLEHAMRTAASDATIAADVGSTDSYVVAVSPVLTDVVESDGIVAVATELLAAYGGCVSVNGGRMELLVPIFSEAS
jgi:K+-sensing histidine kinase KdpD